MGGGQLSKRNFLKLSAMLVLSGVFIVVAAGVAHSANVSWDSSSELGISTDSSVTASGDAVDYTKDYSGNINISSGDVTLGNNGGVLTSAEHHCGLHGNEYRRRHNQHG